MCGVCSCMCVRACERVFVYVCACACERVCGVCAHACVCGWVLPPKAAWPTACAAVLVCVCKGADARLYLLRPLVLVATSDGDGHVMAT